MLKRTPQVGDAKAMVAAIAATNLDTVVGQVQWNGANLPPFAAKNVAKTPLVGGQWRLKDGNKYDIVIIDNQTAPNIPVGGKMEPIALDRNATRSRRVQAVRIAGCPTLLETHAASSRSNACRNPSAR